MCVLSIVYRQFHIIALQFRIYLNLKKMTKHTIIGRLQRNMGSLSKIKIHWLINSYFWYELDAKYFSNARIDSKDG